MAWVLLIIGAALVALNLRALKKEENSFNKILHNTEDDMEEFEVRLGEVRREFSETILELQRDIIQIREMASNNRDKKKENIDKVEEKSNEDISERPKQRKNENKSTRAKEEKVSERANSVKIDEVNRLIGEGLSVDDISTRLGIGKGEVLLIRELYLK